jgi:hypothetical protein
VTDLLIRNVPAEVVAAIDTRAQRLRLSRNEYLRRQLTQDATVSTDVVTVEDLSRFAQAFSDLSDPDVMNAAWE